MAIHDWTRVYAGYWHDFLTEWAVWLRRALNAGILPKQYVARIEQKVPVFEPDLLTLERKGFQAEEKGGVAVMPLPKVSTMREADIDLYRKKNRTISVRHVSGDRLVALIELVSPGNKNSTSKAGDFVSRSVEFLDRGIHLMLVDLFPPRGDAPRGLHALVWERFTGEILEPDFSKPLNVASFECRDVTCREYCESLRVGDALPTMPLFLQPDNYVQVPLEATYQEAWAGVPDEEKAVLEAP